MQHLVGVAEIASRFDVDVQTVHSWRRRFADDFPDPVAELQMGLVWYWPDVDAWKKKHPTLGTKRSR